MLTEVFVSVETCSTAINAALENLGSGPVVEETPRYDQRHLIPANDGDRLTHAVTSGTNETSLFATGRWYNQDPGANTQGIKDSALKSSNLN